MNFFDIQNMILQSGPADWRRSRRGNTTTIFCLSEVNLRIESTDDPCDNRQFEEDWATKLHSDQQATCQTFYMYYQDTLLQVITLVHVDGARAALPLPNLQDRTFDELDYKIAEILDESGTLEKYIHESGLAGYGRSL